MNPVNRLLAITLSLGLFLIIFELVRRRKLKEKYAVIWLITGLLIFILAVFDKLLYSLAFLLGIKTPINAMFFLGIFFIILNNLFFTLVVSRLSEDTRKMAQRLALLEFNIKNSSSGGNRKIVLK